MAVGILGIFHICCGMAPIKTNLYTASYTTIVSKECCFISSSLSYHYSWHLPYFIISDKTCDLPFLGSPSSASCSCPIITWGINTCISIQSCSCIIYHDKFFKESCIRSKTAVLMSSNTLLSNPYSNWMTFTPSSTTTPLAAFCL